MKNGGEKHFLYEKKGPNKGGFYQINTDYHYDREGNFIDDYFEQLKKFQGNNSSKNNKRRNRGNKKKT